MHTLTKFEQDQISDYYTLKLVDAWKEHGKIIICVDFDNTLLPYYDFEEDLCKTVIDTLHEAIALGARLILYTCRDGQDLNDAIEYCNSKGLNFEQINNHIITLPSQSTKPYCNIMLDDKAGLVSALYILQAAIRRYRWIKNN